MLYIQNRDNVYYIRDATGNILATYKETKIEEFHIYGSSRLGTLKTQYDTTTNQLLNDQGKLILGSRNYELTNHLGNVLAVISDKKILLDSVFQADVVSANDYYPFGMVIESRTYQTEQYRFSFNGQERDTEININIHHAEFWKYDARTVRRWNTDPVFVPFESPYATFRNNPIMMSDPNGDTPKNNDCPDGDCSGMLNEMATQLNDYMNEMWHSSFRQSEGMRDLRKPEVRALYDKIMGLPIQESIKKRLSKKSPHNPDILLHSLRGDFRSVAEHGSVILYDDGQYYMENYTHGKFTIVQTQWSGKLGHGVAVSFTGLDKSMIVGHFHTHIIDSPNGKLGIWFSRADLRSFFSKANKYSLETTKYVSMVDAGNVRYAVVLENRKKLKKYVRSFEGNTLEERVHTMINTRFTINNGTATPVLDTFKDSNTSGVGIYQTIKRDKTSFKKIN